MLACARRFREEAVEFTVAYCSPLCGVSSDAAVDIPVGFNSVLGTYPVTPFVHTMLQEPSSYLTVTWSPACSCAA